MARLPKGFSKRSDGRLMFSFTVEGKRYSVYGQTVKECREKELDKRERIREGLATNQTITLGKYYDEWQQDRRGTVKDSTIYVQDMRFERVRKTLGKKKLQKIERCDIVKVQKELAKTYTTSGVNDTIEVITSVLNAAVNDRIISWNPCNGIKAMKRTEPDATENIHRALTEQEQQIFFKYAEPSYYYNMFRFLLQTGCRTGEAAALTWQDIDRKEKVIRITKSVSRTDNKTWEISTPKNKSSIRTIPLTESVEEVLRDQRQMIDILHGNVVSFDNLVFPRSCGKGYVNASILCPIIRNVLKRVENDKDENGNRINPDMKYFAPHAFRDTFATRCIEQGMNPQTLKSLLGHSSLAMTMDKYAQVLENVKQQEINKIRFVM